MSFDAFDRTLDLVAALRPLLDVIGRADSDLAKQLRRAAVSVGLNLAEGAERRGVDRRRLYTYAYGSVAEVVAGLRIAVTFGYLEPVAAEPALALADRVKAMAFRLSR